MTVPATRRLFFALWPDPPVREQIAAAGHALAANCRGKLVPAANVHLTLVFLGEVSAVRQPCIEQAAARIQGAPFTLILDKAGSFRGPGILWMGPGAVPEALAQLHYQLATGLEACGFEPEARAFRPHITLMRKAYSRPFPAGFTPIAWPVTDFALVESSPGPDGSQYCVVARWGLGCTGAL